MNIRRATDSDYHALMGLYNKFVNQDRYTNYDNDNFDQVLKSSSNYIYVVEEEGKLIGFITFSIRLVIRYPKPIAEVDELFVEESYRRQGIAKQLIDQVATKATELNCYRIFIESAFEHEGAHKFYENSGYTKYGYHFIKDL